MSVKQDESVFVGVKLEEVDVLGKRFKFPVRYYDHQRISGVFPVSATKIQGLLPSEKLKPVQPKPSIALVFMTAFEFRDIDGLAPYNEFSISVPVLCKKDGIVPGLPGLYILHLPVTTEEARWAGVEIYGLPKFVADINFKDTDKVRLCQVRYENKDIITLEVKKQVSESQSIDIFTYSVKDKQLLRASFQFKGHWGTSRIPGEASFVLGNHPIAEELRGLGISEKSLECTYAPGQQALLHLPSECLLL